MAGYYCCRLLAFLRGDWGGGGGEFSVVFRTRSNSSAAWAIEHKEGMPHDGYGTEQLVLHVTNRFFMDLFLCTTPIVLFNSSAKMHAVEKGAHSSQTNARVFFCQRRGALVRRPRQTFRVRRLYLPTDIY